MDQDYLSKLTQDSAWLPGQENLLAAFRLPLNHLRYLLIGESPYPRPESANGYAFWDQAVHLLWSEKGLSKAVNRATSLRNLLKALLAARGDLGEDCSQTAIARLDKRGLIQTVDELFGNLLKQGFLLLNASLVYSPGKVPFHARQWRPFMASLLQSLERLKPESELILLGKIADQIPKTRLRVALQVEHPYNISFITNPQVINFFKPLDLLAHEQKQ